MRAPNSLGRLRNLPLSSWLAITLLAVITAMLIAPDIDPPDTVLKGTAAPVAMHVVRHHTPHRTQQSESITTQEFDEALSLTAEFRSRASDVAVVTTPRQVLRC